MSDVIEDLNEEAGGKVSKKKIRNLSEVKL